MIANGLRLLFKSLAERITISEENKEKSLWIRFGFKQKRPEITEDNTIAYKLIAGLYISYVSPELYKKCIEEGIVDVPTGEIPTYSFENMKLCVGLNAFHRITFALYHSNIDTLKEYLERVNKEPKIVVIQRNQCHWYECEKKLDNPILIPKETIVLDIENKKIISNNTDKNDYSSPFMWVEDYADVLDALASELNRDYCNTRHLRDRFARQDFFNINNHLSKDKYSIEFKEEESEV